MLHHYTDYQWKKGIPSGIQITDSPSSCPKSYKIVTDPYHKQYTIEEYSYGKFERVIYDSLWLDFRRLTPRDQKAWSRETLDENDLSHTCIIRDINDRVLYIEIHRYEGHLNRSCELQTPQGWQISIHRMYYEKLGDPFNGVVLYDAAGKSIMKKTYAINTDHEFEELLEECWELNNI